MTQCPKCGYNESHEGEAQLYWQRNPRYKGLKLGNSQTSMQNYGCALMSFSYVTGKDPLEVNQLFTENGVYSGNMIIFEKACEVLGLKNYEKSTDIKRMPSQEMVIKEVVMGRSQHFVVRINRDGKRFIFDPWVGMDQPVNLYPFRSYRIFDK